MLKWISNLLGNKSNKLPEGIDTEWLSALEKYLEPLTQLADEQGRAGLTSDIFNFVVFGEPISILYEILQKDKIKKYFITDYQFQRSYQLSYKGFNHLPSEIALRWAIILDSCLKNQSQIYQIAFPGGIHWPEALMLHAANVSANSWSSDRPKVKFLTIEHLEKILVESEMEPSSIITAAFNLPLTKTYGMESRIQMISTFIDYSEAVCRYKVTVSKLLFPENVQQKLHVIKMLYPLPVEILILFSSELCDLAVSSSKQVRATAEFLLSKCGATAEEPLKNIAIQGKPEQRLNACRLIWDLAQKSGKKELQEFVRERAKSDNAPSLVALIGELEATLSASANVKEYFEYEVPSIDWSGAMTPQVERIIEQMCSDINKEIEKANKSALDHHEKMKSQGYNFQLHQISLLTDKYYNLLTEHVASSTQKVASKQELKKIGWNQIGSEIQKAATQQGMNVVALVKVLDFFGMIHDRTDNCLSQYAIKSFNGLNLSIGKPSLLELQQMLSEMNMDGAKMILNAYCYSFGQYLSKDWKVEDVWPFFAHNQELLIKTLIEPQSSSNYWFDPKALFRAISTMPAPPLQVVNALFNLALGSGKTDRPLAQSALANHPGKEARIINALSDGKAETRTVAAQWLAMLKYMQAIPELETVVLKEKNDVAKGAMLDALQSFGQPVEKYLDRKSLSKEAANSLVKGLPKDLEWFPFNAMPQVRWADSGESVPHEVLRWFIVQAVKQKNPEPNAVLRKYCSMFNPRDREVFGQFILEVWLREDVHPISPEDAAQRAATEAQNLHSYMHQYPQYYQDEPKFKMTVKELEASMLPSYLRQPAGSQIGTKGLLAVVAACANERAAAPVAKYIKEYYGTRAAQGKALIQMLAWIEHPSATQLMLSIGNRFRTKSFQAEATKQAEALAERKGWTLNELADRTIPSGGFDENAILELSYGSRIFTAKLLPDYKVELYNPDGKKIAALPDPRQDDDTELAKDAKKILSNAKKEIKSIVTLQTDRLYEALCTEREWSFSDWNMYLNQHPVVRRLIQGLVWAFVKNNDEIISFRPLDDGTLTDVNDDEIEIHADAKVKLAHDSVLPKDSVEQWLQHLLDYKITPLFQQLGKGTYMLPESKNNADKIEDFEGYLLEAYSLRNRALKLGYTRGAAMDGGWFTTYEKRFTTLGLTAVIEFTGNPLPEENRTVALLNISFVKSENTEMWNNPSISLINIPKILISECYNDMRLIAAEGSGFDSDWAKKSEY
jgi:hypothetical protein